MQVHLLMGEVGLHRGMAVSIRKWEGYGPHP